MISAIHAPFPGLSGPLGLRWPLFQRVAGYLRAREWRIVTPSTGDTHAAVVIGTSVVGHGAGPLNQRVQVRRVTIGPVSIAVAHASCCAAV